MKRVKNGIYYSNKTKEKEEFLMSNLKAKKRYNPYRSSNYDNCAFIISRCNNRNINWRQSEY